MGPSWRRSCDRYLASTRVCCSMQSASLQNVRFVEAKRLILSCVLKAIFVKNTKIVILAGSAALLYKATFICVRTGNRPFHESAINNASE